jgi:hypothetical protein
MARMSSALGTKAAGEEGIGSVITFGGKCVNLGRWTLGSVVWHCLILNMMKRNYKGLDENGFMEMGICGFLV